MKIVKQNNKTVNENLSGFLVGGLGLVVGCSGIQVKKKQISRSTFNYM